MRIALVLAAAVLALSGCTGTATASAPSPSPSSSASSSAIRIAVVGDSITDAKSADFSAGDIDATSWVDQVIDDGHVFAGGWAVWGATTEAMRAGVRPVDADVLIVLAGTNDVLYGVPFETTAADLRDIARTVSAPNVVVSAIPPIDSNPGAQAPFNARLEDLAKSEGWTFVDPTRGLGEEGRYKPGMSYDGLHPTLEGAQELGRAMRAAVFPDAGATD